MEITHNIQFSNPSTLLLGKPGTGKTSAMKAIIEAAARRDSGMSFVYPWTSVNTATNREGTGHE